MAGRRTSALSQVVLAALALACVREFCGAFVQGPTAAGQVPAARVTLRAIESGKVNLAEEAASKGGDIILPPEPVLECDASCIAAIEDCLGEGCSVEALMKLDKQLAEDEKKVGKTVAELKELQKTEKLPEAVSKLAWLDNFLSRTSALRGQLMALKPVDDTPFVQKIVKAASVAFGGGRPNDYPKVGVSAYTE